MTLFIDPPAAETAAAARERYQALCKRLEEQKLLRAKLRQNYEAAYDKDKKRIQTMKGKLQMDRKG